MSMLPSLRLSRSTWVTVGIILAEIILVCIIYLVGVPYFQRIQDQETADQIARHTISAFWYSVSDLDLLCYEWTTRPELARFIAAPASTAVEDIFPEKICDELDIDILWVMAGTEQQQRLQGISSRFAADFTGPLRSEVFRELNRLLQTSRFRVKHVAVVNGQPFYILCLPIRQPNENIETVASSGYLVFVRHLDRSDAAKLTVLLQQTVSLETWITPEDDTDNRFSDTAQGLATYHAEGRRIEITCTVPGLERRTGFMLNIIAERPISPIIERIAWIVAGLLVLINALALLLNLRSRELIRKRLQFMLRIVNRISGRLFVQPKPMDDTDEVEQLHAHLDNLFLNIQRMHKERELFHARDVIREKLIAAGRIAAELSHEILTPIRVIRNCLAPLQRKLERTDLDERDRKMFDLLSQELNEMEVLVRNLLQYFREGKIEGKPVRLTSIVDAAISRFQAAVGDKGPVLKTMLFADATVFVSDHQLEQVILNLLQNATDANCTEIRVESSISDDDIFIHVQDNGDGIPDHVQDRIFEPFFTRKKERGVGLGLNISYNIVRNYDGELFLDRKSDNTHFVIRLPVMTEEHDEDNHPDR